MSMSISISMNFSKHAGLRSQDSEEVGHANRVENNSEWNGNDASTDMQIGRDL